MARGDEEEKYAAAAAWATKARINNYNCLVCGEIPLYDERETYFETQCCGYHAYQAAKAVAEDD